MYSYQLNDSSENTIFLMTEKEILKKIRANKYVVFYKKGCPYCKEAFEILNSLGKKYAKYDVDDIRGGKQTLLEVNRRNINLFNKPNKNNKIIQSTFPMIFRDGLILGGTSELKHYVSKFNN